MIRSLKLPGIRSQRGTVSSWRPQFVVATLVACGLVILVTTAFILVQIVRMYFHRAAELAPEPTAQAAVENTEPPDVVSAPYVLKGMIISLGNRNETLAAQAQFDLVLECPTKQSHQWMQINRAAIRDAVYEATISFTVEDFSRPEGFSRVKRAILEAFKHRFGPYAPTGLLIHNWVIR